MGISAFKQREKLLHEELTRIVKILVEKYMPEKIILFGSLVGGHVHEWSDIDLLIVKETSQRPIDRVLEVARLVRPKVGVDFFVYTPSEVDLCLKEEVSFLRNVLKQGKILYEKGNTGMGENC